MNRSKHLALAFLLAAILCAASFPQAAAETRAVTAKPFVLGVVEQFRSGVLKEDRTLNIYLPPGYDANAEARYPVIYLLDGSADEDFIHVVGIVQFNNFSWVNRVPSSIVVGIANVDRRRDFTFPTRVDADKRKFTTIGRSEKFISFIEKELQPFVDNRYKTNSSRTLIGHSLGGLVATEILFKKPELFDKYIIISPSLWWDNGSLLEMKPEILNATFSRPTSVYIGVGKEGFTPSMPPRVMEEDAKRLAEKIKATRNRSFTVYFDFLPLEDHATVTHQAVFNAFRMLYPTPASN